MKFFVKLSSEEIICCIYSVVSLLLRRYKACHSCPDTVLSRAVCTAGNKSSGSISQTWEHKLYWEDKEKIQAFQRAEDFRGYSQVEPGSRHHGQTSAAQAGKAAGVGVQQP